MDQVNQHFWSILANSGCVFFRESGKKMGKKLWSVFKMHRIVMGIPLSALYKPL
jgi:hypothetical protein